MAAGVVRADPGSWAWKARLEWLAAPTEKCDPSTGSCGKAGGTAPSAVVNVGRCMNGGYVSIMLVFAVEINSSLRGKDLATRPTRVYNAGGGVSLAFQGDANVPGSNYCEATSARRLH